MLRSGGIHISQRRQCSVSRQDSQNDAGKRSTSKKQVLRLPRALFVLRCVQAVWRWISRRDKNDSGAHKSFGFAITWAPYQQTLLPGLCLLCACLDKVRWFGVQGVVAVMQSSAGDVKDDAAGVLRNCSNYSVEATEVQFPHSSQP